MISKIYLAILAASTALMAFFTYYAWSWLQSIGAPAAAMDGYHYNDGIAWAVLLASGAVLLIVGNVILWMTEKAWALWSTLLYFVVFILLRYFVLNPAFFEFSKSNGMSGDSYSTAPLLGAMIVIAAAIFIFCDQFAVLQLHRKMYPPGVGSPPEVAET